METNLKLLKAMYPNAPEKKESMAGIPYCDLVGKLQYLAVATRPDPLHQGLHWGSNWSWRQSLRVAFNLTFSVLYGVGVYHRF
jgi:hypothetical protein